MNNSHHNSLEAHRLRNSPLLRKFRERNISLTDTRSVELHFWAHGQAGAVELANALKKKGYTLLRLNPANAADSPDLWNIEVAAELSIEGVVHQQFVSEMIRLAEEVGAEYDGWGTVI